jgi:hypothetical protein
MKIVSVPGYKDLFDGNVIQYENLLTNVSSDTVAMLLISLNAELILRRHIKKIKSDYEM